MKKLKLYNNFNWYNAIINGVYSENFTEDEFSLVHYTLNEEIKCDSRCFNFVKYYNGINYAIYCGARIQQIRKILKPIFGPYKIIENESLSGMVTYNLGVNKYPQGSFIIFIDSLCIDSHIVHEATHLTDAIIKYMEINNGFDRYKYREFTADLCTSIFEDSIHFREYRRMDFYVYDLVDKEWKGQRNGFDKEKFNPSEFNRFKFNQSITNKLQD